MRDLAEAERSPTKSLTYGNYYFNKNSLLNLMDNSLERPCGLKTNFCQPK